MITFDEFKKVEMKVGKILEVEDHPNADKLLILKVDVGSGEIRQLVAGLKPFYSKESLKNKLIVVVTNLQPVVLRGTKSEGMLLAAQFENNVVILSPEKNINPGSIVL